MQGLGAFIRDQCARCQLLSESNFRMVITNDFEGAMHRPLALPTVQRRQYMRPTHQPLISRRLLSEFLTPSPSTRVAPTPRHAARSSVAGPRPLLSHPPRRRLRRTRPPGPRARTAAMSAAEGGSRGTCHHG